VHRSTPRPPFRSRRGVALVAALGLLMLGAALLAGSALSSLELRRATRARTSSARAESEVRFGLGTVLRGWDTALDSLPIGARAERAIPAHGGQDPTIATHGVVRRLTPRLYVVTVRATVGREGAVLAVSRALLFLERSSAADSAHVVAPVVPLSRWSVAEIH
jgi:hypothetical protein